MVWRSELGRPHLFGTKRGLTYLNRTYYAVWLWRRREEKERAAAAAADAAEAQSAPAAQGKEAADKAAKKLEGNARCAFGSNHLGL